MTKERQTCPRCGKARKQEKQGSITQWITTCSCLAPEEAELENVKIVPVCQKCGKRVNAGRSGSFTQWVFRSDLCSCEKPDKLQVTAGSGDTGRDPGSFKGNQTAQYREEPELAIDPKAFPVDRYQPIALLDKGASGVVYLSRDRLLGTRVAVKCLIALSAEQLISFQNEARANSKLTHPNIVKVLNFGATESGAPYMVMEYIHGITLKKYIEEDGVLPLPVAIGVFTQICSALSYAHGKEIFHRDLKSSNIMLVENGAYLKAYLLDFGVAMVKHATQEPTIVQGYSVVGTPLYMPPDQSIGRSYDQRSEIYSLGCVIFEALTGSVPFLGETALEIINMHASQQPPLLSEINEDVDYSEELQAIVSVCLEKEQDDRFQSADQLANALKELGEASDVQLAQEYQGSTKTASNAKMRFLLAGITLIMGAAVAGIVAYIYAGESKQLAEEKRWQRAFKAEPTSILTNNASYSRPEKATSKRLVAKKKFVIENTADAVFIRATPPAMDFVDSDLQGIDWARITKKVEIDLSGADKFSGAGLMNVPPRQIYSLNLSNTFVQDANFKAIAAFPNLESLSLDYSPVSIVGLRQISNLKHLRRLQLGQNQNLDDRTIELIVNTWPKLRNLHLNELPITCASINKLTKLQHLECLFLSNTLANDNNVLALSRLKLSEFYLSYCPITDKSLATLEKMKSLKIVGLFGCVLSDQARNKFRKARPDVKWGGEPDKEYVQSFAQE
jgi:Serine/threonine protein kinase